MPRYLPNLNALRAFEAAGRLGGFLRAAEELNVTHAAVSRHVHNLESQLGVTLFRRAPRGVTLTEDGLALLAEVTPALDALSKAAEAARATRSSGLAISCEPTFAMKWLMPRLGAFEAAHPGIDVSLESSAALADVAGNAADMAIRYSRAAPEGLAADLISASPMYPYAAPGTVAIDAPADLLGQRLLHEDDGRLWREWFRTAGIPERSLPPLQKRRFDSLLAIEGALAGQGVVLTSRELAASDLARGRLQPLSEIGLRYGAYRLVYRSDAVARRPLRAFRRWLLAETREFREGSGDEAGG